MCVDAHACQSVGARWQARTMTGRARSLAAAGAVYLPLSLLLLAIAERASSAHHIDTSDSSNHIRRLQLFGWHLELEENVGLQSPFYKECTFYKGRVHKVKVSKAFVTECEGEWHGLLQVGEEIFVLPPRTAHRGGEHVVRRRDVLLAMMPQDAPSYNLTDDTDYDYWSSDDEEEEEPPPKARIRTRSSQTTREDFLQKEPTGLWLELAIVADNTMVKFHGDKVNHYILALMNIVSGIYSDPSLGANMTLVINKVFLLEKHDNVVKYEYGISQILKRVNKWNKRHLLQIPTVSTRWDALVWLTRTKLGGPSGLARMNSICSFNSATVQRDEGFTSAFVIAHELGHLLGLHHDDDDSCDSRSSINTIMAPVVRASLEFAWSPCSVSQFNNVSRKWKCLHSRSTADGVELGPGLYKTGRSYVFSMDQQCRVEFGEGFSVCTVKMEAPPCTILYCAHHDNPLTCYSKNAPPLEHTICKKHHWCSNGNCVSIKRVVKEEQSWGPWMVGACKAYCGYGLRMNKRVCLKPQSNECRGSSTKVLPCWSGVQCAAPRDVRGDLCRRIFDNFIPYIHSDKSKQCQLQCVDYKGGTVSLFGSLPDGTSCSYDRPYDVCYRGVCLEGRCNSSDSGCNWCHDRQCKNYTHNGVQKLRKDWTTLVEIPKDAHHFLVSIPVTLPIEIGIRPSSSQDVYSLDRHSRLAPYVPDSYFKYDINVPMSLGIMVLEEKNTEFNEVDRYGFEGKLVVAGTVVEWNETDTNIVIWTGSQLASSITILVAPKSQAGVGKMLTFALTFSMPQETSTVKPQENRKRSARGPCSASCGGGVRAVHQRCQRGQICRTTYESCNQHRCDFKWAHGDWEECSQSCGDGGIQDRQIFCIPADVNVFLRQELIRHSVSPVHCLSEKPSTQQPCNRFPCPVYWQELSWTPCSKTCGVGEQYRPVMCPVEDASMCGPRPQERRQRCYVRRKCPHPRHNRSRNTIKSCNLIMPELLKNYCGISYFRRHCSETCSFITVGTT